MICYSPKIKHAIIFSPGRKENFIISTSVPNYNICYNSMCDFLSVKPKLNIITPRIDVSNVIIAKTQFKPCFLSGDTRPFLIART